MTLPRLYIIALSFGAVGCPLLVDDHLQIVPRSSAGAAGVAGGGEDQAGAGTNGGFGGSASVEAGLAGAGEPPSCGVSVLPVATVACPASCDRCEQGRCIFDCNTDGSCTERQFACPTGLGCKVECTGKNACTKAVVACPPGFDCDLVCNDQSACKETRMTCSDANCTVTCGQPGACEKAVVTCADAQCGAKCLGGTAPPRPTDQPELLCGRACACNPC